MKLSKETRDLGTFSMLQGDIVKYSRDKQDKVPIYPAYAQLATNLEEQFAFQVLCFVRGFAQKHLHMHKVEYLLCISGGEFIKLVQSFTVEKCRDFSF